jgi:hypothetical protein
MRIPKSSVLPGIAKTFQTFLSICLLALLVAGPALETGCGSGTPSKSVKKKRSKKRRKKPVEKLMPGENENLIADVEKEKAKEEADRKREAEERAKKEEERRKAEEAAIEETMRKAAEERARRERELEEEEARIEAEERRKREEEEQRRRADAEFAEKELKSLFELEGELAGLARKLRFDEAVEKLIGLEPGLKSAAARDRCREMQGWNAAMKAVFAKMVSKLKPGTEIRLSRSFSLEVESADAEGFVGKVGKATTKKTWASLDKPVLLSLFDWDDMSADDEFGVGLLAYLFDQPEEAEKHLLICAKQDADRIAAIGRLVASRRGRSPGTVLFPYRGLWVTEQEKKFIDEGKELYKGNWMSREEVMKAKGFILHEGQWLTKEEYEEANKEALALAKLTAKLSPKGLIDKPGADKEQLPWHDARKFTYGKKANYIIESNLSMDAVKDIAYIMEVLHYNFRRIFRIRRKVPRFTVRISKNKEEYDGFLGGGGLGHCSMGGEICTFYQPPNTTMVLMHEGVHQFLYKFSPCCPSWLHESMATYFECSKFVVNPKTKSVDLKTGILNKFRLGHIQKEMKDGTYTPLRDQICGRIGGLKMYHQGWALSYYLINAKGGVYAPRLFYYLQKYAGKGGIGRKKGQREDRQVMRFMKALGIYDIDEFEEEWKKYILSLKLADGDTFNSGHR